MYLNRSFFASGSLFLLSSSLVSAVALHGPYHLRSRDAKLPVIRIDQKALPNNDRQIHAFYFPDGNTSSGLNATYQSTIITVTRGVEVKDNKPVGINWCPEMPKSPPTDGTVYWCLDIRPKDGPDGEQNGPDSGDTLRIDMRKNTVNPSTFDGPDGFTTLDKNRCKLSPDWETDGKPAKAPGNSPGNQRTWECTVPLPWVALAGVNNSTSNATTSYVAKLATGTQATSTQPPTTAGTAVSGSPPIVSLSPVGQYLNTTTNSTDSWNATSTSSNSSNLFSSSTSTDSSDNPTDSPDAEQEWYNYMQEHENGHEPEYDSYDTY